MSTPSKVTFEVADEIVEGGRELYLMRDYGVKPTEYEAIYLGRGEEGRACLVEIAKVIDEYLYPWNRSGELPELGRHVELNAGSGVAVVGYTYDACGEVCWATCTGRLWSLIAVDGWRELRKG